MSLSYKTLKPSPLELASLDRFLKDNECGWEKYNAPGAVKRCRTQGVVLTYYKNGKLLLQGKGTQALLAQLWPHYLDTEQVKQKQEKAKDRTRFVNYVGADESGKGDYFGPLVTAAVYVTQEQDQLLSDLGVRDSKTLSDTRIMEIYPDILENCSYSVEVAMPENYNAMYIEINNLNTLLAKLHQRNISKLVREKDCTLVIVDKFANERVLLKELKLPHVKVKQFPRAENRFTAVAAASIIARAHFLYAMQDLENQYDVVLPKGATNVIPTGLQLVERYGTEVLQQVAKLHFKTTGSITKKV